MSQINSLGVASSGTVTSISQGTGIVCTPNPITGVGTVALSTPVSVTNGGTGVPAVTAYAPIVGGTTGTNPFQSATSGFSNNLYVLTSNGNAALPSWQENQGVSKNRAFLAATGAPGVNVTGNGVRYDLVCDTVFFDQSGTYSTGTGEYFVTSTGMYLFYSIVRWTGISAGRTGVFFNVNGAADISPGYPLVPATNPSNIFQMHYSAMIYLMNGDSVKVVLYGEGAGGNIFGYEGDGTQPGSCTFGGALLWRA